jgi:hypothetical protein
MLKKILFFILAAVVCMSGTATAFAADDSPIGIDFDGRTVEMPAMVWDGELFLPLRAVSEEMGFEVQWDGSKREITISKNGKLILLSLQEYKINVNGHESYLTTGYRFLEERTYLHHDFFTENIGVSAVWNKDTNRVTLQKTEENPVVISTKAEASETATLKLTIQYPELKGLDNAGVQEKLNSLFAGLASAAKDRAYEIEKYIGEDEITRHIKAEGYFNYQVKYNRNGLLSVVFYDYQYSGGAHGSTVQSSYTFDLTTGAEYELKDLFPEGSDYVSLINSEIKKQIKEEEITDFLAPFDTIRTDHDFYLSGDSIVIYFQQYEILPYSYGIPEFSVDRPQLGQ